ncbi:MAG: HEAT repeat domain-containing protein, partial [Acidobacteria bacterium]|nr:HEAT repeat domain-containing protein [Acidobacteriota bacterium]
DQVAQSQPAPSVPTAVTTTPAASGTSLGTVLKNNWLLVLIAALLLISVGLVAMNRSRSGRDAAKTRPIGDKETPALEEGEIAKAEAGQLEEATMAGAIAAVVQTADRPAAIEPATMLDDTETLEAEPVESFNIERVRLEIKHILTGQEYDESVINAPVKETRQLIESELLFALSKRNTERRERALKAFTRHGYFDDATRDLRTADVPAERAAAARKLGLTRDQIATPHLVAALEDSAPEVRRAAIEALTELGDPAAVGPLESLLVRKEDRKVPHALVQRAIKASAAGTAGQKETPAAVVESAPVEEAVTVEAQPAVAEVVAPPIAETEASSPIAEAANLAAEAGTPSVVAASLVSAPVSPTTPDEEIQDQRTEAGPAIEAEPPSLQDVGIVPPVVEVTTEASTPAPAAIESAVVEGAVTAAASAAERHRAKADAARIHAEQERLRVEEEARRREEEVRQREEAEAARLREEETRRAQEEAERERVEREEAAARQREEEELERQRAAEARRREEEEERQRVEAEAQRQRDEAEAEHARAEEERARAEEETRRHAEEERRRVAEEERQRAEAEAARIQFEQEAAEHRRREEAEAATYARIDEIEPGSTEDAGTPAMQPELFESTLVAEPPSFGFSNETSAEIAERNPSDWFAVDFNEPEVLPVAQTPLSAAVADDAAIKEYERAEAETLPIRDVEESPADSEVKEIELSPIGRGSAFAGDDFASVPGGIMRRLSSEVASERAAAVTDLARIGGDDSFREISAAFDDPAQLVRDAAARALFDLQDDHASSFTRALRESPADRRRRIGNALASSGLANEAISHLMGESREKTYDAFSLLFLMSKAGEVQPLMRAIEEHPNSEVRLAVVKLLALSGQQDILPAFRRLAVRGSLPTEVRSAVMEAIYQISSQSTTDTTHVA